MKTETFPVLTLRDMVVFPNTFIPLSIGRPQSIKLILQATENNEDPEIVLITQKDASMHDPPYDALYEVGTLCRIVKVLKEDKEYTIIVEGQQRVCVQKNSWETKDGVLWATFEPFNLIITNSDEEYEQKQYLLDNMLNYIDEEPEVPPEVKEALKSTESPEELTYNIASNLNTDTQYRQELLEASTLLDLLKKTNRLFGQTLVENKVQESLSQQIRDDMERSQKDFYLKQQLKAIRKELGEDDSLSHLEERIEQANLPEEVLEQCIQQTQRLNGMSSSSSEYSVTLTYIETLLSVPWSTYSEDNLDLKEAKETLDADHYGLDKVKERILEYLAVRALTQDMQGPIICLSGPPGVGKTSISKSIARALGRKFIRISLGGVTDESEIRGHRRTYVGAMAGRFAKALIKTGTNNPLILLDEIDKLGRGHKGDPQSAMLEVLDPEQNKTFGDHYLEVPLDLSNVLFIATANELGNISGPLRDRMEIIQVPSYTRLEKKSIAQNHLLPKQIKKHGLTPEQITLSDDGLETLIDKYTREAGVRGLERQLANLCRGTAVQVAHLDEEEREDFSFEYSPQAVIDRMGPPRYTQERAQRTSVPGVATGLAWTSVGGEVLFVEASKMVGKGKVKFTGQLGDVMRESAEAALSYLRANSTQYNIPTSVFDTHDFHVHFPAGAIPKDGPSAGVTIFTALLSMLKDCPVDKDVAMTGEITLRGHVLAVGGIKEKLTAAHRAGITTALIPKACEKDLVDLNEEVREDLEIHLIERVGQLPALTLRDPSTLSEVTED